MPCLHKYDALYWLQFLSRCEIFLYLWVIVCAWEILNNVFYVIAIELFLATQALDFRTLKPGEAIEDVKKIIRERVPFVQDDCILYPSMQVLTEMLKSNIIVNSIEQNIGDINF